MTYRSFDDASGFDIIGDVHGHAAELNILLQHLGYAVRNGAYRHPDRKALFVGDLFNRGPESRAAIDIVMKMCQTDEAVAVVGNHEYNDRLIALRDAHGFEIRSDKKDMTRFEETMAEYAALNDDGATWHAHQMFLYGLPLYYENAHVRISHAARNPRHMDLLAKETTDGYLSDAQMIAVEKEYGASDFASAVIDTVRGPIVRLHELEPLGFKPQGGRDVMRVKWWALKAGAHQDTDEVAVENILLDIPKEWRGRTIPFGLIRSHIFEDNDPRPHFFGHYKLNDTPPHITSTKHQCLDFGTFTVNGKLTAYRFDIGDTVLLPEKLVTIPIKKNPAV